MRAPIARVARSSSRTFPLASPTSIRIPDDSLTRMKSSPLQWSRPSTNAFQGPGHDRVKQLALPVAATRSAAGAAFAEHDW
jgi:hypothetical protein